MPQPKPLKVLSANSVVKVIATYSFIQYLKLPQALLEYLKVLWLRKKLYCSEETLKKMGEEEMCNKILKRVHFTRISPYYSFNKVIKLHGRCNRDIRLLRTTIRSSDVNTDEHGRLLTIFYNTLRYHTALIKVHIFLVNNYV